VQIFYLKIFVFSARFLDLFRLSVAKTKDSRNGLLSEHDKYGRVSIFPKLGYKSQIAINYYNADNVQKLITNYQSYLQGTIPSWS